MSILKTNTVVPFDAWDPVPEKFPDTGSLFVGGVSFNTYRLALQATLELLGTRLAPVPVILPVTSSPATMSAVLRSGAAPYLLDVDYLTLQMDATQLQEALQELGSAIVILSMPGGKAPVQALTDLLKDLPTVVDTRLVPPAQGARSYGDFTTYDLSRVCGGGVVYHNFPKQLQELKIIRSGALGHSAELSLPQLQTLSKRLPEIDGFKTAQLQSANAYKAELQKSNKSGMIVFEESENWPYFLVRVPDAARAVAHLQEVDIDAQIGCFPLYHLTELSKRWKETPQYPAAEKLYNEIVALPTTTHIVGGDATAAKTIETLLEVVDG